MVEEEWVPVRGFETSHEVSNKGRVKSLSRRLPDGRNWKGKILSGVVPDKPGRYARVRLSKSPQVIRSIHRLVAEAFIPNPEGHPLVLHGPEGKTDNSVGNLRWGTYQDNNLDTVRDGNHNMKQRTHCPQNHEYTEENTYVPPGRPSARHCRKCKEDR